MESVNIFFFRMVLDGGRYDCWIMATLALLASVLHELLGLSGILLYWTESEELFVMFGVLPDVLSSLDVGVGLILSRTDG